MSNQHRTTNITPKLWNSNHAGHVFSQEVETYSPGAALGDMSSSSAIGVELNSCLGQTTKVDKQGQCTGRTPKTPRFIKPKRPLTAYNFFFQSERAKLLGIEPPVVNFTPQIRKRRKHRKTHGKIGFTELSQKISRKWRTLDDKSRAFFLQKQEEDRLRYNKEMSIHNEQIKSLGRVIDPTKLHDAKQNVTASALERQALLGKRVELTTHQGVSTFDPLRGGYNIDRATINRGEWPGSSITSHLSPVSRYSVPTPNIFSMAHEDDCTNSPAARMKQKKETFQLHVDGPLDAFGGRVSLQPHLRNKDLAQLQQHVVNSSSHLFPRRPHHETAVQQGENFGEVPFAVRNHYVFGPTLHQLLRTKMETRKMNATRFELMHGMQGHTGLSRLNLAFRREKNIISDEQRAIASRKANEPEFYHFMQTEPTVRAEGVKLVTGLAKGVEREHTTGQTQNVPYNALQGNLRKDFVQGDCIALFPVAHSEEKCDPVAFDKRQITEESPEQPKAETLNDIEQK